MTPVAASPIDELEAISLDDIVERAELLTRTDRKYVLRPDQLDGVLRHLTATAIDPVQVLEIDGRRTFGYESVYLDTPQLDSYLGAARRRPNRFKVRTRSYLETRRCMLEVKLRTRRGQTVKHRHPYEFADRARLTGDGAAFVSTFPNLVAVADRLTPVITTRYARSTLVVGDSRTTIDRDVRFCDATRAAGLDGLIVVETKSAGGTGVVDRALWAEHIRPVSISKFGVGMACLHPTLPANKWHRIINRHLPAHPL